MQFKYGGGVDKLTQYQWFALHGIPALEFTDDVYEAKTWLEDGHTVFGRVLLHASCGKGIVVMEPEDSLHFCPVYTKYKKKKREFRVHVFKDQVVSVVEKKKRKEFAGERDTKIRNLANGYVFCQTVENEPEGLRSLALAAAQVSPSDFRGVDIGYNERNDELFVIEVNSAPGIEGTNLIKYAEKVLQYV
jgi:RimK-like ATP-grasp domain